MKKCNRTKKKTLWIYLILLSGLAVIWFNNTGYASYYEYMIIVHDSLDGFALQQFINHKQSRNFHIDKQVISDGTSNSDIKTLIQQAFYNETSMLQFVLLVGTAAFDTVSGDSLADASKGNFIPTHYAIDCSDRRTAFDQWYVEVDTLRRRYCLLDIHIGRLPATNEAELQAFVDKLIYYENDNSSDSWKWNVLFLAGDVTRGPFPDYPSPTMVNVVTDELMNDYTPDYMVKNVLHASDFSTAQGRKDTTVSLIDNGQLIINALGTGACRGNLVYFLKRFGSGADFDANIDLSNYQKYPFVIGASCHLAQFDTCLADTLNNCLSTISQNLLFSDSAGAIALFGGSGGTREWDNFELTKHIFSNIFDKDIINLGQLSSATKIFARYEYDASESRRMYTLLGDPSMDLGIIPNYIEPFSHTGFELTDPICHQNCVFWSEHIFNQVGKLDITGSLYIENHERHFKIDGDDSSQYYNSFCYWKLYEIEVPIDSVHRFLSFYLNVEESPGNLGHISIDGYTSDGYYLRDLNENGYITDQYGERIHPAYHHHSPAGWWQFYAFDLENHYGKTISTLLVGYDDSSYYETGHFRAFIDEIKFSPDWGSAPYVSEISMPHPIYVSNIYNVYVDASDYDDVVGDQLSFDWWLDPDDISSGYITGSGDTVIYHAPASPKNNIIINVEVSDKGGHTVTRADTFNVIEEEEGCPFVYIWNGEVFVNDNVILTGSEDEYYDRSKMVDYCVLFQALVPEDNYYKMEIREFENEVSFLDQFELITVDYPERENIGITPEGKIWTYYMYLSPISCVDQNGVDRLDEIIRKDRKYFISRKPGYLIVNFGEISRVNFYKPAIPLGSGGGGTPIPPGDKMPDKLATLSPGQARGNIVYVDVLTKEGEWQNIAKVYPRTTKMPTLVELAQYADPDEDFFIKIRWERSFSINHIAYYCLEDDKITINRLPLVSAVHTNQGEITTLLNQADDQTTTLSPEESIRLFFPALPDDPEEQRGFILATRGYYEKIGITTSRPPQPRVPQIEQNYPNPFNQFTHIKFSLPEAAWVTLNIYNILGQKIITLMDEEESRGTHSIIWDGKDKSGKDVASGIYFYQLKAGDFKEQKKMLLIK